MILDVRGVIMKKNDVLLAVGVAAAAAAIFCFQIFRRNDGPQEVTVTVRGEVFGTYSLAEEQTVSINDTNRLVIAGGKAHMEWADCPDQVCVDHSEIWRDGESIICLPNEVVVTVQSTEESGIDGIVG